jgi:hypothetical protein
MSVPAARYVSPIYQEPGCEVLFETSREDNPHISEIAVAVHRNMRFLLLDEPTASKRYRASRLNPVIATITLWNTVYLERAAEALARSRAVDYC